MAKLHVLIDDVCFDGVVCFGAGACSGAAECWAAVCFGAVVFLTAVVPRITDDNLYSHCCCRNTVNHHRDTSIYACTL